MPGSNITKRALVFALKELMETKPFSKISVSDICETCEVSRQTFYYHFKDKYDLVEWIFNSEFISVLKKSETEYQWLFAQALFDYFYHEREFYKAVLKFEGQNSFREYFGQAIAPIMSFFAQDIFDGVEHVDFYVTFFSDAILISIIRWLTEGAQIPPEEYLSQLRHILVRLAKHTIDELGPFEEGVQADPPVPSGQI